MTRGSAAVNFTSPDDLVDDISTWTYDDELAGPADVDREGPADGYAEGGGRRIAQTEIHTVIPTSTRARGLALSELSVAEGWDGLFSLLGRSNQIYFLSLAFDLSGEPPLLLPPQELSGQSFITVPKGESFHFTLGDGAPLFLPRPIVGGLGLYIEICEADDLDRVGSTLTKIHDDLSNESDSLLDRVTKVIKDPGRELASQALSAAFAILKPVATALAETGDDHIALVQGTFPAQRSWEGRLVQDFGRGSFLKLAETGDW